MAPSPYRPGDSEGRRPDAFTIGSVLPEAGAPQGRGPGLWLIGGGVVIGLGLVLGAILWIAQSLSGGPGPTDPETTAEAAGGSSSPPRSSTDPAADDSGEAEDPFAAAEAAATSFMEYMVGWSDADVAEFACSEVEADDIDQAAAELQDNPEMAFLDDIRVHDSYYEGDDIHVVMALNVADEVETTDPLVVTEEDGAWLVCGSLD
ncbi:hypothetical protein [Glycomyces xiaoerkulensis]|uniref:hypothetical protein n=1 Tax=Glycomyces xiaoerkulensis TaxID=2038139 RepID=UPI000C263A46|nr:hypothetical protein [Glycomyces xiaoerkulensis]